MYSKEGGENYGTAYYVRRNPDYVSEQDDILQSDGQYPFRRQTDMPQEGAQVKRHPRPESLDSSITNNIAPDIKGAKLKFGGTPLPHIKKVDLKKIIHLNLRSCINPDVLIKIGNNNIYGHRTLLRAFTDFFDKSDASSENYCVRIPEDKVTAKAFDTIYNWMLIFQEEPASLLNRKNLMEVYIAAQFMQVRDLEKICKSTIDDEDLYSEGNAFFLYMDAFHFKHKDVMDLMLPRVQRFFLPLVSTEEYIHLPVAVVTQMLTSNFICVHCEVEVFMSGVRWLLGDWDTRSSLAHAVMRCVRFGLMTPSQLVDIRRSPDSPEILEITQIKEVNKLIDDGIAFAVKVHCHEGDLNEVSKSCKALGLSAPEMRHWIGKDKKYRSYQHFLDELEELRKESKMLPISKSFDLR